MDIPLILISNDDGYDAKGINDLVEMVRKYGDVFVVAPDGGRSGAALSITSKDPVTVKLIKEEEGLTVYSCSGTPCDCVKMAFEKLLPRRPDLVLGGINHGDNSAVNVHYSGTMGAAIEACMKGVNAIGLSSCKRESNASFEAMRPYIEQVVEQVLEKGLPKWTCLNLNAPASDVFKGIKMCRMTYGEWTNEWEERKNPRGFTYYWLTGSFSGIDEENPDTDKWALNNGYIAVTPIKLDMTDYDLMDYLD